MKNSEALELTDFSSRLQQLAVARQDSALAKEGRLCMYFDTHDVRRAILGAREYVKTDRSSEVYVDKDEFDKPEVLPACLMAGGFLGQFTMLAPHQHELLRQMQTAETFSRNGIVKLNRDEFLRKVGISEPWGSDGAAIHDSQALRRVLKKYAGKRTEQFYKAVQCIRLPWWRQLSKLRTSKTFVANSDTFEYSHLLASKLLPKLLEAISKRRNTFHHNHQHLVSQNNFADAICILMLIELVSRFNAGTSKVAPRFFDGTGLFRGAARLADVESKLQLKMGGSKSSALVGPEYIMFRASLAAHTLNEGDALAQLAVDLNERIKRGGDLGRLQNAMRHQGLSPLTPRFDQLLNFSFLENVWLRTIAEEELKVMASDWAADLVNSAEFRQVVETTISEVSGDVLRGADEYKKFSATWLGLRAEIIRWRSTSSQNMLGLTTPVEPDVYGLALSRISPAERVIPLAKRTLDTLGDDGQDDNAIFATAVWSDLFAACMTGVTPKTQKLVSQDDLEAAATVLWCIGAYGRVVDLYNNLEKRRRSYAVRTAGVAAMLKLGRDAPAIEGLIEGIARDTPTGSPSALGDSEALRAAEQASSLGYLWFHCWQLRWKLGAWWRCGENEIPSIDHPHYDRLLRKAIDAVEASWAYINRLAESPVNPTAREIYVANQCLYYLVELGDEQDLQQMESMQNRLMGYKDNRRDYWRQTYSDTLSRYFAFRAHRTANADHWRTYMGYANKHFRDAHDAAMSESTVQQFGEYLTRCAERGFVGQVVRPGLRETTFRNTAT